MTTELSHFDWHELLFYGRAAGVDDAGQRGNGPPLHDDCNECAGSAPAGTVALQAADAGVK